MSRGDPDGIARPGFPTLPSTALAHPTNLVQQQRMVEQTPTTLAQAQDLSAFCCVRHRYFREVIANTPVILKKRRTLVTPCASGAHLHSSVAALTTVVALLGPTLRF
jgi:hypothetical protein